MNIEYFFYFISLRAETIFAKIYVIFYKNVLRKKHVSYAVTALYKNYMMLDFINKRNKKFNFKAF